MRRGTGRQHDQQAGAAGTPVELPLADAGSPASDGGRRGSAADDDDGADDGDRPGGLCDRSGLAAGQRQRQRERTRKRRRTPTATGLETATGTPTGTGTATATPRARCASTSRGRRRVSPRRTRRAQRPTRPRPRASGRAEARRSPRRPTRARRATQTGVGNVHVSVRVGSPGDDGSGQPGQPVDCHEQRRRGARVRTTTPRSRTRVPRRPPRRPSRSRSRTRSSRCASSVRAPTEPCLRPTRLRQSRRPPTQRPPQSRTTSGTPTWASGSRAPASVARSGSRATVDAESTPGGAVTVATDGIDTVVIADIVAPELTLPVAGVGGTTVWEWIWTWNADESTLDDAGARLVSGESWNWTWDDLPGGTVVEREATADEQAGSWSWDWSWSRELDGWAWGWAQSAGARLRHLRLGLGLGLGLEWSAGRARCGDGRPSRQRLVRAGSDNVGVCVGNEPCRRVGRSGRRIRRRFGGAIRRSDRDDGPDRGRLCGRLSGARRRDADDRAGDETSSGRSSSSPTRPRASRSTRRSSSSVTSRRRRARAVGGPAGRRRAARCCRRRRRAGARRGVAAEGTALASAVVVSDNEQSVVQHGQLGDGLLSPVERAARRGRPDRRRERAVDARSFVIAIGATRRARRRSRRISPSPPRRRCRTGHGARESARRRWRSSCRSHRTPARSRRPRSRPTPTAPLATSNAAAINRSLSLQAGTQAMNGASAIDIQELLQEAIVVQTAFATSSSTGGIGGAARTVNCSTIDQSASQGIGALIPVGSLDLTSFCAPPLTATRRRGRPGRRRGADLGGGDGRNASQPTASVATVLDEDVAAGHGTRSARLRPASLRPQPGSAHAYDLRPSSLRLQRLPHAPRLGHRFPSPSLRKRASTRARRARREGKPSTGSRHSRRREAHHRGSRRSPKGWQRSGARGSQRSSSPSCSRRRRFAACATERSSGDRSPCSHRSTSLSDPSSSPWTCRPGVDGRRSFGTDEGSENLVTEVHCSRRLHARVGSAFGRARERR